MSIAIGRRAKFQINVDNVTNVESRIPLWGQARRRVATRKTFTRAGLFGRTFLAGIEIKF